MVITHLIGGLGNQMFQYAAGRALAMKRRMSLRLDVTAFETYKLHEYSLWHLNIKAGLASRREIARFTDPSRFDRLLQKSLQFVPRLRRAVLTEKAYFEYDASILQAGGGAYLDGYWQNERYFKDIESVLRTELEVATAPDPLSAEVAEHIKDVCAVSVHVRRGDYAASAAAKALHGLCDLDYYAAAILRIRADVTAPHFFVFSDDPVWTRANLRFEDPVTFVTHNRADRNYEDLRLMTLCQHHIIANSSFSWWGAWLGRNPGRRVIAPRRWLAADDVDTSGVIPERWSAI
jgi:hypothetical protein